MVGVRKGLLVSEFSFYFQSIPRDRKVGFDPAVKEMNKDYRLRRRDTPHYLKNKRVKEEDAEQKVLEILAQAAKNRDIAALSPVVKVRVDLHRRPYVFLKYCVRMVHLFQSET